MPQQAIFKTTISSITMKTIVTLNAEQLQSKVQFIKQYIQADNAASASAVDSNANVSDKNIATLEAELNKDINIQINRRLMYLKIETLFGTELANEYIRQIEHHEIYIHDETSLKPYCASISMYPFLFDGLTKLSGESRAPEHLESYCGSFVNLVFAISSQFAGALATVEFLLYFDYFAHKDYGDHYLKKHLKTIQNHLQHCVYAINQPAAARGYQSVFWNISIYDRFYFESMFGDFVFPDFSKPNWERLDQLQRYFMQWFNEERTKAVLTFPVVTAAMLIDSGTPKDKPFADFCSLELANGNAFFIYQSEKADSLASCCRLRNEISDNTFSYSLGAGGVSTGSINVITININRLIQDGRSIREEVIKIQKYQVAYRYLMQEYLDAGLLPVYKAGFIQMDKQFLTIGINGLVEAAEYIGIEPGNNSTYQAFVESCLKPIYEENKQAKIKYGFLFNTEFVPAENLGPKNAAWDKKDGYYVPRDCYNSYFYPVESKNIHAIDKFLMHGKDFNQFLDGGSALHLNLEEYPSQEGFRKLLDVAAKTGCNYFCFNVKITICRSCGYINKRTLYQCSKCASKDVDHATRVIGYLKKIESFSMDRKAESALRHYHVQ